MRSTGNEILFNGIDGVNKKFASSSRLSCCELTSSYLQDRYITALPSHGTPELIVVDKRKTEQTYIYIYRYICIIPNNLIYIHILLYYLLYNKKFFFKKNHIIITTHHATKETKSNTKNTDKI